MIPQSVDAVLERFGTSKRKSRHVPEQVDTSKRRLWMLLVLISAAVFALFAVLVFPSKLASELASLRSRGLPTNFEELNTYFPVPVGANDTTSFWVAAASQLASSELDKRAGGVPYVGAGPLPIPKHGDPWAELEESRRFLKSLEKEMLTLRIAAGHAGVARYPVDYRTGLDASIASVQQIRTMARLFSLSAHVHLHDDEPTQVFEDVNGAVAVSNSLQGTSGSLPNLVRIATHAMACELIKEMLPETDWNDNNLEILQLSVAVADFRKEYRQAIFGEQAYFLESIQNTPGLMFRDSNSLKGIEYFGRLSRGLEDSWQRANQVHDEIEAELKGAIAGVFGRLKVTGVILVMPALKQSMIAGMRAEARQNCLLAALAAMRFRLRHGVSLTSLSELIEFIPGETQEAKASRLIDPFTDAALVMKFETGRLMFYSVGENRIDDAGQIQSEKRDEGDIGYSLDRFSQP